MSYDFTELDKLLKKDVAVGLFYTGLVAAGSFLLLYFPMTFRIAVSAGVAIFQNLILDRANKIVPDNAINFGLIAISTLSPWMVIVGMIKSWAAFKRESFAKALTWVYIPLVITFVVGLILYFFVHSIYLQSFQ